MKKQKGSPRSDAKYRTVLDEAGQTLIEIILAFSVAILVLSAVVVGVTTSLNNTQHTKNQNIANFYAQEGMAVIRQIRDSSWPDFFSKTSVNYCLSQNSTLLNNPPCGVNVAGIYSREVEIRHNLQDCSNAGINGSKVAVKVLWSDSKCPSGSNIYCHKIELISCLSNIDQKQAP